jgi:radical SAM superfamily enzyme YgiQ (UPF0313 family)
MKVMMINPPFSGMGGVTGHGGSAAPLNLGYLVAYLREHDDRHEYLILDAEARRLGFAAIEQEIREFRPDWVGITMGTPTYLHVMEIVNRVKTVGKNILVAVGGPHPSGHASQVVAESEIDFAFAGESEESFRILVDKLTSGGSVADVPGLAYRDTDGTVRFTPKGPLIDDLDKLPFPARDLLPTHLYHVPATREDGGGAAANMITSRGCPYHCTYCDSQVIWTRRVRLRSPMNVVDEIQECYEQYGARTFTFHDDIFCMKRERTIEICREICRRKLDITWSCMTRVNFVWPDAVAAMKKAGCAKLLFGLESGSNEILKILQKNATTEQAREAFRITKAAGIKTGGSFMIGNIGDTEETIRQTIAFAKSLDPDTIGFFVAVPYPGTQMYKEAKKLGYLRKDLAWEDFAVVGKGRSPMELPNLSAERIRELQIKALREFYFRPRYMLRKLSSLRSFAQVRSMLRGVKTMISLLGREEETDEYKALKRRQARHTHCVLDQVYAGGDPGQLDISVSKPAVEIAAPDKKKDPRHESGVALPPVVGNLYGD